MFLASTRAFPKLTAMITKTVLLPVLVCAAALSAAEPPPHILLFVADDLGWSEPGCYGGEIHTPQIDRLAVEGLRFSQFHGLASPRTARTALLSGLVPGGGLRAASLPDDARTLGDALRAAGYRTGLSGKWEQGATKGKRPYERGFDETFALWARACDHRDPESTILHGAAPPIRHNDHTPEWFDPGFDAVGYFTDEAIRAIRVHATKDQPFFHVVAFPPPWPRQPREELVAKYKGVYDAGPQAVWRARARRAAELGLVRPEWPRSEPGFADEAPAARMQAHAAMVEAMDAAVGRVLETIDELGLRDNTLVLFLSDNGARPDPVVRLTKPPPDAKAAEAHAGLGPAWARVGQGPTGGAAGPRIPCVARWPGVVEPAGITDVAAHLVDVLPTLVDVAGGRPEAVAEGVSLLPVLRGEDGPVRANPLCWAAPGARRVREGRWQLDWDPAVGWRLFDLRTDGFATYDMSAHYPERVLDMAERWTAWTTGHK